MVKNNTWVLIHVWDDFTLQCSFAATSFVMGDIRSYIFNTLYCNFMSYVPCFQFCNTFFEIYFSHDQVQIAKRMLSTTITWYSVSKTNFTPACYFSTMNHPCMIIRQLIVIIIPSVRMFIDNLKTLFWHRITIILHRYTINQ